MCIKKCSCSGVVKNIKGNIYADICPKGRLKNSFVTFPNIFRSVTVEKPKCFHLGNTLYLTTAGTGLLNLNGKEVEGAYALILSDTGSKADRFVFEFFAPVESGYSVALFISLAADVSINECKNCQDKKVEPESDNQAVKPPIEMAYFGNYARKVIFHPNGRIEEEDLLNCTYNR